MENSNTASMRCLSIEGEGGAPKPIREIAWKAQLRLCARYRKLAGTVNLLEPGGTCTDGWG